MAADETTPTSSTSAGATEAATSTVSSASRFNFWQKPPQSTQDVLSALRTPLGAVCDVLDTTNPTDRRDARVRHRWAEASCQTRVTVLQRLLPNKDKTPYVAPTPQPFIDVVHGFRVRLLPGTAERRREVLRTQAGTHKDVASLLLQRRHNEEPPAPQDSDWEREWAMYASITTITGAATPEIWEALSDLPTEKLWFAADDRATNDDYVLERVRRHGLAMDEDFVPLLEYGGALSAPPIDASLEDWVTSDVYTTDARLALKYHTFLVETHYWFGRHHALVKLHKAMHNKKCDSEILNAMARETIKPLMHAFYYNKMTMQTHRLRQRKVLEWLKRTYELTPTEYEALQDNTNAAMNRAVMRSVFPDVQADSTISDQVLARFVDPQQLFSGVVGAQDGTLRKILEKSAKNSWRYRMVHEETGNYAAFATANKSNKPKTTGRSNNTNRSSKPKAHQVQDSPHTQGSHTGNTHSNNNKQNTPKKHNNGQRGQTRKDDNTPKEAPAPKSGPAE